MEFAIAKKQTLARLEKKDNPAVDKQSVIWHPKLAVTGTLTR